MVVTASSAGRRVGVNNRSPYSCHCVEDRHRARGRAARRDRVLRDPAIGPAKTTTEIRAKVSGLLPLSDWFSTVIRVGLELCLPAAGDVNAAKLVDVVHRIRAWGDMFWPENSDVQVLADNTKKGEETKLYPAMLATDNKSEDQIAVGVNEAWVKFNATKGADFMTALTTSSYTTKTLGPKLARRIVDAHLATLLPPSAAPTKATIAWCPSHDETSQPLLRTVSVRVPSALVRQSRRISETNRCFGSRPRQRGGLAADSGGDGGAIV